MKIYMDNCCYNRLLDDRSYSTIYYERNTILFIMELIEKGEIELVGSEMLQREINDTTDIYKKSVIQAVYSGLCTSEIMVTSEILDRAEQIRNVSNIKFKDSIHLACAESAKVNVLLTTDRKFINNSNRIKTYVEVKNPNDWILEVLYQ